MFHYQNFYHAALAAGGLLYDSNKNWFLIMPSSQERQNYSEADACVLSVQSFSAKSCLLRQGNAIFLHVRAKLSTMSNDHQFMLHTTERYSIKPTQTLSHNQ